MNLRSAPPPSARRPHLLTRRERLAREAQDSADDLRPVPLPPRAPESVPDRILRLLGEGPLSGKAIVRRLGLRRAPIYSALRAFVAAGVLAREGRGPSSRFRIVEIIR
jgi:hypothetical protein